MAEPMEWARAYAIQGEADYLAWEQLQDLNPVYECHRLMFLQMACEKLAKAHLCAAGSNPAALQVSHRYIAKNLPPIIRQQIAMTSARLTNPDWIARHTKQLASEIEILAPAIKRGGQRPDNCEYPWEDSQGTIHLPISWAFTPSDLLSSSAGRTFLKLVQHALKRLTEI